MGKTAQFGVPDTISAQIYIWNVTTWEWESATKGSGVGQVVEVENFPAVISGTTIPVSGVFWQNTQKITLDGENVNTIPTEDNKALAIYQSSNILYMCKASIGSARNSAVWQIRKIDGMDITWADGNDNYDNLATDLPTVAGFPYS